jgi:hypothetical protein
MDGDRKMKAIRSAYLVAGLACLMVGCRSVTPDSLRTQNKYASSYHCGLNYEEAYKHLMESKAFVREEKGTSHDIYRDSKTATIYRHYGDQPWWVIDIKGCDTGGCEIRTYGITESRWETADNIVRALPDIRRVSP